jgi:thiamine pyrophosphate-dependent acetolactate synthase large subunit-like protein
MMDFGVLCEALETEGLTRVFGIPGTQTLGFFDAIRRSGLEFTLASHELGAAFMANGYFRACGKPAVVATIGGPGFTNALTGIAEARLDSAALVHIVSAPATAPGERYQLQAIDQPAIAAPLVKACYSAAAGDDLRSIVADAVTCATGGEPGPVLIQYEHHGSSFPESADRPITNTSEVPLDHRLLEDLADRWSRAVRPVFLVGQGAVGEAARLRRLAERTGVPVVTTPSARGIIPEDHPLALGFDVLRGGVDTLNVLFERSDLILAVGCKLGHNGSAGFNLRLPEDRLVRVDTSSAVLEVNYPATLSLEAEAARVLAVMEEATGPSRRTSWPDDELAEIRNRLRTLPSSAPDPVVGGPAAKNASEFFGWLRSSLPRDAILVTDSGLHQILARRYYDVLEERGLILPSDFQSMGFGIPAGIGASFGAPQRPIAVLVGDGGLLMSGMEIGTAVRERIPLLVIVFNDGHLNQIRLQQISDSGQSFGVDLASIDIRGFSEAMGARYLLFDELSGKEGELGGIDRDGPTILEVCVGDSWAMRSRAAGARLKDTARSIRDAGGAIRSGKLRDR